VKNYIPESVRQYAPSVETVRAFEDNAGAHLSKLGGLASAAAASPFALPVAGGLGALALGYAGKKLYDRYKNRKTVSAPAVMQAALPFSLARAEAEYDARRAISKGAIPAAVAKVLAPQSNPLNGPSSMVSPLLLPPSMNKSLARMRKKIAVLNRAIRRKQRR
jgi:hypothetical protein